MLFENKEFRNIIISTRFLERFFSEKICYIGPLRDKPKRYYPVSGATMIDAGFTGEKSVEIISSEKEIFSKVKEWLEKFDLAENIKIRPLLKRKTLVEVLIKDKHQDLDINLSEENLSEEK